MSFDGTKDYIKSWTNKFLNLKTNLDMKTLRGSLVANHCWVV